MQIIALDTCTNVYDIYVNDCRFTGCTHTKEKGCRVLQAVKDGDIPASRHRSYLRLFQELKDVQAWQKK